MSANSTGSHNIKISTDKQLIDKKAVFDALSRTYWGEGLTYQIVSGCVDNSMCWGVYDGVKQIGFARVISDKTTFAYLADVYILEEYRGNGYSKMLMKEIMAHPELQNLRKFWLSTKDAHGLYAQFGFKPVAHPEVIMEIMNPNFYVAR
ncbi:MAG: GNAT family N-acetyltransferase [Ignavibacteriaceae bacterium]|nr:GNAT family N-acetyltransferase [Ignavibacteriaceae bacterium]